ncbi:MAG TPA: sulfurtransferase, partial [Mycobacterium sp.]|nr:sulfurtransferase [Mycobacterium sp.]HYO02942.1 sulfurtransferase [Mycobacterium sp.]
AMGMALSKLPYNRGATCDAQTVVSQLVGPPTDQKAT